MIARELIELFVSGKILPTPILCLSLNLILQNLACFFGFSRLSPIHYRKLLNFANAINRLPYLISFY